MRRALILVSAILVALLATGSTAGAAGPRHGLYFELHSGGFLIQARSTTGTGQVRLALDRDGEVAFYKVPARIGTESVEARFGRLGALDFRFTPDRGKGRAGCGDAEGWQHGTFVGSLVFRGEHHYAHVDAHRARGYLQTYPTDGCGKRQRAGGSAVAARASGEVAETGASLLGESASYLPLRIFYIATENRPTGVRVTFNAFREERREGMRIDRGAEVRGGTAAFAWNLLAGTARVEPPAPFSGRAFFRREPGGRSSWWGSLRAPVLGGPPMRLTGAAFQVRLGRAT